MRVSHFSPRPPWTRSHEKFAMAWGALASAHPRLAMGSAKLERWIYVRWGVHRIRELTPAQARAGCRQLNAWRASVEGRVADFRPYPRQARRNYRLHLLRTHSPPDGDFKAFERMINERVARTFAMPAASITATRAGGNFENLIAGTALEGLGRLVPTESAR